MSGFIRSLGAAGQARVDAAWVDSDVSMSSFRSRFRPNKEDVAELTKRLGPKATVILLSARALNHSKRARKAKALLVQTFALAGG